MKKKETGDILYFSVYKLSSLSSFNKINIDNQVNKKNTNTEIMYN